MGERWNLEDADDGGLDHEPGDIKINEMLRRAPKVPRVQLRPAEPSEELKLAVFDRGPYAGRSPFDQGEIADGVKVRDGVPDKFLEKVVATTDGGFAKSAPPDMDSTLYAACVSALAWRRGVKEVPVNQVGPRFDPYAQPQNGHQAAPPGWQPGMQPSQPMIVPPSYQQPWAGQPIARQSFPFPQSSPQAVRMPCGHLSSDVASGQGGRPVCGGCARLEALQAAVAPLAGESIAAIMQAVREWEFQLRSDLNV